MALLSVTISAAGLVQIMSRLERILDVADGTQQIPFRKARHTFLSWVLQ
jgi:hypothetical protein